MEAKMIANSVPVKPTFPKILIEATEQVIQAGQRIDDRPGGTAQGENASGGGAGGKSLKKKAGNKDEERLRKLVAKRHGGDTEAEEVRTYRNFDERRLGFLVIGEQHRLIGASGQNKFIYPEAPPIDFSYCMVNKCEEIVTENEQPQTKRNHRQPEKTHDDRYKTSGVRLSYNVIDTIEGLINVLFKILDAGPIGLCWLDLSFNAITKLDEDTFSQLPNLKILYLHGNCITDMTEVPTLMCLKQLHTLTLHGNPVEEEEGYRIAVLNFLPRLKHFDFIAVTKSDKANVQEFGAKYLPYWEQRHDQLEAIYQMKMKAGQVTHTEKVMQGPDDYDGDDVFERD